MNTGIKDNILMLLIKKILRYSLGIIFLISGLFLIISGKNILHLLPLPEQEVAHCHIPSTNEVIRIYQGNLGATVDYWYVVTYQQNFITSEKTILRSYGGPDFMKINCLTDAIELIPQYWWGKPYVLQNELIRSSLIEQPIGFDLGNHSDIAPSSPVGRLLKVLLGTLITLIGVLIIKRIRFQDELVHSSVTKPLNK
jgi:hypothetical protein